MTKSIGGVTTTMRLSASWQSSMLEARGSQDVCVMQPDLGQVLKRNKTSTANRKYIGAAGQSIITYQRRSKYSTFGRIDTDTKALCPLKEWRHYSIFDLLVAAICIISYHGCRPRVYLVGILSNIDSILGADPALTIHDTMLMYTTHYNRYPGPLPPLRYFKTPKMRLS